MRLPTFTIRPTRSAAAARSARRARLTTAPLEAVLAAALLAAGACRAANGAADVSAAQRTAIADSIRREVMAACDLSKPDVVKSMMSLYPDSGRVVSASAGAVVTTRDSVQAAIRTFWDNVGRNMRDPKWTWGPMYIDVLARDAAVMTATYSIPHTTPHGMPHVVGGAWTAVFARRGGRWVIVQEHLSDRM